jgi:hypothetical protein
MVRKCSAYGEKRTACRFLVGNLEGTRSQRRPRFRFRAALGPRVYSASDGNEYQKQKNFFWVIERGRRIGLTTSQPYMSRLSRHVGTSNISPPSRPPITVTRIAVLYFNLL